ncbi:MAG: hypothetical protein JXR77_13010 [Lentisphaeria bacterium]|nr:hypothetical protein [Lentisphaeria bacterium]
MPPAVPSARRTVPRPRRFTLVELLLAMALVVVVAFIAFRFFANVQNVWHASVSASNAHDDARLALELVARDLQVAVAREDDQPGRDILFHQPAPDALWFVSVSAADSTADCDLVEVGIRLNGTRVERAVVDRNSDDWNIYGDRDDAGSQAGYRPVIDTAVALQFVCYDDLAVSFEPVQSNRLPRMINISLTVLDARDLKRWRTLPDSHKPAFEKRCARTFWKTVRLP